MESVGPLLWEMGVEQMNTQRPASPHCLVIRVLERDAISFPLSFKTLSDNPHPSKRKLHIVFITENPGNGLDMIMELE